MDPKHIPTSLAPEVNIERVSGSLDVKGWEDAEVSVRCDPDDLELQQQEDVIQFSSRGDCALRLPAGATLKIDQVDGDARCKLLEEELHLDRVSGSLVLRNVADTHIGRIDGDLSAKRLAGSLEIETVNGDASVRDMEGNCLIDTINGDLELREVEGQIRARVDGDVQLDLGFLASEEHEITAGGDVLCQIPVNASVRLILDSDSESISVNLPGEARLVQGSHQEFVVGGGAGTLKIKAGGSILINSRGPSGSGVSAGMGPYFDEELAQQVSKQIESQMQSMTQQMNEQLSRLSETMKRSGLSPEQADQIMQRARATSHAATSRAEEKMRRAQEKLERQLEAARRREEQRGQAADRRAQSQTRKSWTFEFGRRPPTPRVEPEPAPRATDEERLMILRMLEEKKISLDEAEKLLAALEDQGE